MIALSPPLLTFDPKVEEGTKIVQYISLPCSHFVADRDLRMNPEQTSYAMNVHTFVRCNGPCVHLIGIMASYA